MRTTLDTTTTRLGTVIVGAGPAGLATSARLAAAGHEHVVLEQGRVGETWRTQRWDSFRLNTPRWMNAVTGGDGFATADEFVRALELRATGLPVVEHAPVGGVWRRRGGGYLVATDEEVYTADNVVAASGAQRLPHIPEMAFSVSGRDVEHLHPVDYRRPGDLPDGAVLVVGAAQSGGQIAEELRASGRRVLLATSMVPRMPRRYRGREIMEWGRDLGMLDQPTEEVDEMLRRLPPLLIGSESSLSLQSLARDGVELLGHLAAADGTRMWFDGSPVEYGAFADDVWHRTRAVIEDHIAAAGLDVPDAEPDEAPLTAADVSDVRTLDLRAEGITSVLWATGYRGDFGWLRMPILDPGGLPIQHGVETASPGLFAVGIPWLTHRMSGGMYGMERDAAQIAAAITGVSAREERLAS